LLNLCVNARDALPSGGTLVLSARNLLLDDRGAAEFIDVATGPYVVIDVVDTGVGMTPETLDRAFEPFFTTKGVGKGTGLGLATSLAIVKRHHGFLRVTSEPGVGTDVTVFLPANPGTADGSVPDTHAPLVRGNGELILVVDDEEAVREITRQTLEAFGYRVLIAADAYRAVDEFEAHRHDVDVVITDMMMPNVDGPSLIATMMRSKPDVKIIATSGLNAHEVVLAAKQLGVALFLPKPFAAEVLLQALHGVLHPVAPQ
jgi:CheY-like chemotaxis protein